jgi:hypothetical protein
MATANRTVLMVGSGRISRYVDCKFTEMTEDECNLPRRITQKWLEIHGQSYNNILERIYWIYVICCHLVDN